MPISEFADDDALRPSEHAQSAGTSGRRSMTAGIAKRAWHAVVPDGPAGWALISLLALGFLLRLAAILSWWPVAITVQDGYQRFAANPFLDPQHPAGYGLIVAAMGDVTRQVAFTVLLQHAVGVASSLLFFAATRRVTGSAWAGLLPAAVILLDGDVVFLEHTIMSETWAILAIAIGLYAAVRVCEGRTPRWWVWPIVCGVAFAVAVMIRTATSPIILVTALAVLLSQPTDGWGWRPRIRAAIVVCVAAALPLLAFATASSASGSRFGIAPSPGWYLYIRVAQFANCDRFTPPSGTSGLCQQTPLSQRPTAFFYGFEPESPAVHLFGAFGRDDGAVEKWSRTALRAQFGDFVAMAWTYLRGYWVPESLPTRIRPPASTGLAPQLDFTNQGDPAFTSGNLVDLNNYYTHFTVHEHPSGLRALHDWQRILRFGGTALSITTILTLIGLAFGRRRARVGVLLFGVGGLSLLISPVLTGSYVGRYTIPSAGPMVAAAAITLTEVWRALAARRARSSPDVVEPLASS